MNDAAIATLGYVAERIREGINNALDVNANLSPSELALLLDIPEATVTRHIERRPA